MKDKILEIIERECWASGTECFPTGQLEGAHSAADEICQMMADEMAKNIFIFRSNINDFSNVIWGVFSDNGFTPEQIDNALNKIK